MITAKLKFVERLKRTTLKIESDVLNGAGKACADTANDLVVYIKDNWSSTSPSDGGDPPAKDTHNLDKSIKAESTGRSSGSFAKTENSTAHFVSFNTMTNGDRKRGQYALAVNDGNRRTGAQERPYIEPAMEAVSDKIVNNMKDRIKIKGS